MKNKRLINLRNSVLVIGFTFQLVWVSSLILNKYISHVEKKDVTLDFLVYYSAGYIIRFDSPAHLYDLALQRQVQLTIFPPADLKRFYPYNHPPSLNPFLEWATTRNYFTSYVRWVLVLVLFQGISLIILVRLMRYLKWGKKEIWFITLSGVLFYPAIVAFIRGQDSAFLLLAVSVWVFGLVTERDWAAGLGLALMTLRPQIALTLALPFIFRRRRVWWWFVAWGLVVFVMWYLFIGFEGLTGFAKVLLVSGQGLGFDVDKMATLMGAILRGYPMIKTNLLHAIGYTGYGLAIVFLCIVWIKSPRIGFKHINLAILIAILLAPHFHGHDLIILLIPVIGVISILIEKNILGKENAILTPMIVSIFLIIADVSMTYLLIYLVFLMLAIISWRPEIITRFRSFLKPEIPQI